MKYQFVIEAHGVLMKSHVDYDIPYNFTIHTYLPGSTITCSPRLARSVCAGTARGFTHHFSGPRGDSLKWTDSNKLREDPANPKSRFDLVLKGDEDKRFRSGIFLCNSEGLLGEKIYDLDTGRVTLLTNCIDFIRTYVLRTFRGDPRIHISVIACLARVGGAELVIDNVTGLPTIVPSGAGAAGGAGASAAGGAGAAAAPAVASSAAAGVGAAAAPLSQINALINILIADTIPKSDSVKMEIESLRTDHIHEQINKLKYLYNFYYVKALPNDYSNIVTQERALFYAIMIVEVLKEIAPRDPQLPDIDAQLRISFPLRDYSDDYTDAYERASVILEDAQLGILPAFLSTGGGHRRRQTRRKTLRRRRGSRRGHRRG